MTRFLFLSDTHCGARPMGYTMQAGYPEHLPALVAALEAWIGEHPVDFVLHGGDMVDASTPENLAAAAALFRLSVPVYLCVGNHDLTEEGSPGRWLEYGGGFFADGHPTYTVEAEDALIHVAPTHWERDEPFRWRAHQDAHLVPEQVDYLHTALARRTDVSHFLLTHSPVCGLPGAQTGLGEDLHAPPAEFSSQIGQLLSAHPHLLCVLGGHNHLNLHVEAEGVHRVTASSWVEAPFDFKLFEVEPGQVSMRTLSLASQVRFPWVYDFDRTFVQGRPCDRGFVHAPG